ncbi:hypothetical protein BKA62DRAFT_681732 [Auriculariales sp. MPI-PUGE-AT-0066]|nr:hypothetical protein BKA62DRAFT_681732 [Auriculariales sp. MPI-PUGE-AT-0066]
MLGRTTVSRIVILSRARCSNHLRSCTRAASTSSLGSYSPAEPTHSVIRKGTFRQPLEPVVLPQTLDIGRWNYYLAGHAEEGKVVEALHTFVHMKNIQVLPSRETYHSIIRAFAHNCMYDEALAIFTDMINMGFHATPQTFAYLIQSANNSDNQAVDYILDLMRQSQVPMDSAIFHALISRHAMRKELEMCIQRLNDMIGWGAPASLDTIAAIIILASEQDNPRLAHDIAASFEASSSRRITAHLWMNILMSSAEGLYIEGTEAAWNQVVTEHGIAPDEGLCLAVLHCAARHGHSELASLVIEQLRFMGAHIQEYHLAPLVEAFVVAGQLKIAMQTLSFMRSHGTPPTMQTASSIIAYITDGTSIERIDAAFNMLDDLHVDAGVVDIVAMNAVVAAAVAMGEFARAVGIYNSAGDWGIKPDVETFKIVLGGCLVQKKREHTARIFEHMEKFNIVLDADIHEALIKIELLAIDGYYEDAFWRLEEMKGAGFKVPKKLYEELAKTCVNHKDIRHKLVIEEMKSLGHEISQDLTDYIQRSGPPPTLVHQTQHGFLDRRRD